MIGTRLAFTQMATLNQRTCPVRAWEALAVPEDGNAYQTDSAIMIIHMSATHAPIKPGVLHAHRLAKCNMVSTPLCCNIWIVLTSKRQQRECIRGRCDVQHQRHSCLGLLHWQHGGIRHLLRQRVRIVLCISLRGSRYIPGRYTLRMGKLFEKLRKD